VFPDFGENLHSFAEVIVRVGLNLEPGQRLLIAEPYELQGVSRHAAALAGAVDTSARAAGARDTEIIWGDEAQLRRFAETEDRRGFELMVAANAGTMAAYIARGDALLFLESSHAGLMAGVPDRGVDVLRTLGWRHFGPVAQQLVRGPTNWTVACAPTSACADNVFAEIPVGERLPRLWADVFAACRIGGPDPLAAWLDHLATLRRQCDELIGVPWRPGREGEGASRRTDPAQVARDRRGLIPPRRDRAGRFFHHSLLDENAPPHVALGDAYPFTFRGGITLSPDQLDSTGFNRTLVHVDLPLDTREVVWSA
jgi:leucyl aminopeptidase (aminopeptidase T)